MSSLYTLPDSFLVPFQTVNMAIEPSLEAATIINSVFEPLCVSEPAVFVPNVEPEPVSIEPVSIEPVSIEPVSIEPVSLEPVSLEPVSLEPVSLEPAPAPAPAAPVFVPAPALKPAHIITITDIFNSITINPIFAEEIELFILPILSTRQLTTSDIPQLVLVALDIVDNCGSFNLSTATLPVLIKMIYEFLVNKYNLFAVEQRPEFEAMFLTSVSLAMRVPFIKKTKSLHFWQMCTFRKALLPKVPQKAV